MDTGKLMVVWLDGVLLESPGHQPGDWSDDWPDDWFGGWFCGWFCGWRGGRWQVRVTNDTSITRAPQHTASSVI